MWGKALERSKSGWGSALWGRLNVTPISSAHSTHAAALRGTGHTGSCVERCCSAEQDGQSCLAEMKTSKKTKLENRKRSISSSFDTPEGTLYQGSMGCPAATGEKARSGVGCCCTAHLQQCQQALTAAQALYQPHLWTDNTKYYRTKCEHNPLLPSTSP